MHTLSIVLLTTSCAKKHEPIPPMDCTTWETCMEASKNSACKHVLDMPDNKSIDYYSNYPINPAPEEASCYKRFTHALLIQHGISRNAWDYYNYMYASAESAHTLDNTLIIALHFLSDEDAPTDAYHYWDGNDWKKGEQSRSTPSISSFDVMDVVIMNYLADATIYSHLEHITITGHSGGGQFTQRYALSTDVLEKEATSHLDVRFIVLNPSSYAYLDGKRWDGISTYPEYQFDTVPTTTIEGCETWYNDWMYGLLEFFDENHPIAEDPDKVRTWYRERNVVYLMGDADIEITDTLDTTCAANAQGSNRFERARIFYSYMNQFFKPHNHSFITVSDVGHSTKDMYNSPEGISILYP